MQNLNTKETMARGVIVLNVSEMPQENISVGKGQNYLLVGDNAIWLKKIPDNSIDSIVTDPPAGISFMGRGWDTDKGGRDHWIAWMQEVATECKRVLKPGGHAFVWAIPRTSHWTATAWENAGFEIRDVVAHIFGSGFPKSLNIGKAVDKLQGNEREDLGEHPTINGTGKKWRKNGSEIEYVENSPHLTKGTSEWEGWGTALKPAREDWLLMRKPLSEKTVAENCLKWGTGGINIDESRVDYQSEADKASATPQGKCTSNTSAGSAPDVDMSEVDYNGERYWYKNEYKWLIDKWLNDEDYVWSELKENLESPETYNWCKLPEIDDGDRILFDSMEGECIRLYESKRKEFERPEQLGRFPANLIHDNSEEVRECFPDAKGASSQNNYSNGKIYRGQSLLESETKLEGHREWYNDNGNASRFFKSIIYQAKASKSERNKGCGGLYILKDNTPKEDIDEIKHLLSN
jgi:hypothetical protein